MAAKEPVLSAVICTLDRPVYLHASLASLQSQTADPDSFEIIVVDNGPDRSTRDVTKEFERGATHVRYIEEPRRGLSNARRTGWRQSHGQVVAYLDDDAVAAANWVTAIIAAFERAGSDVACAGGPVEVIPEAVLPGWFPSSLAENFDLGPESRVLTGSDRLWGCSFAFRRTALEGVDAFAEQLGRTGSNLMANEDVLIQLRLEQFGYTRLYDPEIRITHPLPAVRLTRSWLRRRAYWQGVSDAVMDRYLDHPGAGARASSLAAQVRKLRRPLMRIAASAARSRRADALLDELSVLHMLGYGRGLLRPLNVS